MRFILMGLGAYSIILGWGLSEESKSLVSFFIGGGLGLLLIFGAVMLAVAESPKKEKEKEETKWKQR